MSDRVLTLISNLGENLEVFAARLSTQITALGEVSAVDFTIRMETQGVYRAVLVYRPGGTTGGTLAVAGFQRGGDPTASTDAMNAFFTANPDYQGIFVRSVSPQDDRDLLERQLVVLYSDGPMAILPTGEPQVYAALASADIAAGATGNASIVDGNGNAVGTISVQNRGTNIWSLNAFAIAYYDLGSEAWFAYPGCC